MPAILHRGLGGFHLLGPRMGEWVGGIGIGKIAGMVTWPYVVFICYVRVQRVR